MIFTDYTQKSTFQNGYAQQYRIMKYFKDLLNNWFADKRNIKDQRLVSLLYDANGNLNKDCFKTGTAFNPDGTYAGTTPAVVVSLGTITYQNRPINRAGNPQFLRNPMQPPVKQCRFKLIPIQITVITQSCDGTILLAELIQLFLAMNSQAIQQDTNALSFVNVNQVSSPQAVQPGSGGNAKQLYASTISVSTMSVLTWTTDTQGPVFNGYSMRNAEFGNTKITNS